MKNLKHGEFAEILILGITNHPKYKDYKLRLLNPDYPIKTVKVYKPPEILSSILSKGDEETLELFPIYGYGGPELEIAISNLTKEIYYRKIPRNHRHK